jgi:hypothetical protein
MHTPNHGVTFRAVMLGLLVVTVVGIWATYVELYARSSRLTMGHFPLALFALLLVIISVNRLAPKLRFTALHPSEILVVIAMGLVGAMMPVDGIVGYLLGIISSFYYFATPENGWADSFHPYLPNWLVPQGSDAMWRQFFEGTEVGQSIPWGMWVAPLFWWALFIGVLLWVSMCIMVIVRKQWVEHERLVYPLARVAQEMAGRTDESVGLRSAFNDRLFWVGLSIALLLFGIEILGWFYPTIAIRNYYPSFGNFRLMKDARAFVINPFHFFTMGFAFLAPVEIQFSVWFFYILNVFQSGIFARLGFDLRGAGGDSFSTLPVAVGWQGFGAMLFLTGWGLWTAREHLKKVFRKAVGKAPEVDDSQELVSYRTAVLGLAGGAVFLATWLMHSGMSFTMVVLYLFASFVLYYSTARIVAEGGLPYTWGPLSPQSFIVNITGTRLMTGQGITSLLLSYSFVNYLRGLFMPAAAHVARFGDLLTGNRRRLLKIVMLAGGVSLVVSLWYTLTLAYAHGAYNTYGFPPFFGGNPKAIFSSTLSKIRNPLAPDLGRLLFLGLGTAFMGLFTLLRSRLLWWKLHPIGFVTSTMINSNFLAVPFFLAWAVKATILQFGGVLLYRRTVPLFIGLMVGYVVGVSLCSVVDMVFFPQDGHVVHTW